MCEVSNTMVAGNGEVLVFGNSSETPAQKDVVVLKAQASFAKITYVEVKAHDYKLWWQSFDIREDTTLEFNFPNRSFVGICYTFKNDIGYSVAGLPDGVAKKDFYNLIFLPSIKAKYIFKKGETRRFGVEFTTAYLLKNPSPRIAEITKQIYLQHAALYRERHLPVTSFTRNLISELENYIWRRGEIDWVHLNAKVSVLVDESLPLENDDFAPRIILPATRPQAQKIVRIVEYIFNNPGEDLSMEVLTKEYGISAISLRRGIKHLYGMLPSRMILEARLQAGKKLLVKTDLTLKELVEQIGIADVSHFSKAFKKRFGKGPSEFRNSDSQ